MKFKMFFSLVLCSVSSQSLNCMDDNGDINPFSNNTPPRLIPALNLKKPTPVKNRPVEPTGTVSDLDGVLTQEELEVKNREAALVVSRASTPEEDHLFPIEDRDGSKAAEIARSGAVSLNLSFRRLSVSNPMNASFGSFGLTPTPVKTPGAKSGRDSVAIAHEIWKSKNNRACTPGSDE